jgi:hypothetical protein
LQQAKSQYTGSKSIFNDKDVYSALDTTAVTQLGNVSLDESQNFVNILMSFFSNSVTDSEKQYPLCIPFGSTEGDPSIMSRSAAKPPVLIEGESSDEISGFDMSSRIRTNTIEGDSYKYNDFSIKMVCPRDNVYIENKTTGQDFSDHVMRISLGSGSSLDRSNPEFYSYSTTRYNLLIGAFSVQNDCPVLGKHLLTYFNKRFQSGTVIGTGQLIHLDDDSPFLDYILKTGKKIRDVLTNDHLFQISTSPTQQPALVGVCKDSDDVIWFEYIDPSTLTGDSIEFNRMKPVSNVSGSQQYTLAHQYRMDSGYETVYDGISLNFFLPIFNFGMTYPTPLPKSILSYNDSAEYEAFWSYEIPTSSSYTNWLSEFQNQKIKSIALQIQPASGSSTSGFEMFYAGDYDVKYDTDKNQIDLVFPLQLVAGDQIVAFQITFNNDDDVEIVEVDWTAGTGVKSVKWSLNLFPVTGG